MVRPRSDPGWRLGSIPGVPVALFREGERMALPAPPRPVEIYESIVSEYQRAKSMVERPEVSMSRGLSEREVEEI